jgi:hypothetical protein
MAPVGDQGNAKGGANDPREISREVRATSRNRSAHEGVTEFLQSSGQKIARDIAGTRGGATERVTDPDPSVFGGAFSR